MALKKVANYCNRVAERLDRQNKHDLAGKIREELFVYSWTPMDWRIASASDLALTGNPDATLVELLPAISERSGLSETELKAHPQIQELFDYSKRLNNIGRED